MSRSTDPAGASCSHDIRSDRCALAWLGDWCRRDRVKRVTGAFARKLPIRLRTTVVGAEPRPELDAPLHDRINRRRARSRIAATISTAFVVAIGVAAIAGARGMTPASHRPAGDGSPAPARSGHWSTLPRAPIPAPAQDLSVWTGTKMLVWGGLTQRSSTARRSVTVRPTTLRDGVGASCPPARMATRCLTPPGVRCRARARRDRPGSGFGQRRWRTAPTRPGIRPRR